MRRIAADQRTAFRSALPITANAGSDLRGFALP
jgi:hypothetical protein